MPTLLLLLATALWGGSFTLTKVALQEVTPLSFIFFRYLTGALCMLPSWAFMSGKLRQQDITNGVKLALLQGAMILLQTMSLQTISASIAAFLSGFFVVFVLAIRCFTEKKLPTWQDILAVVACVLGLGIITENSSLAFSSGVLYMLLCAFFSALYLHAMSIYARSSKIAVLTLSQMVFLAMLAGVLALVSEGAIPIPRQMATWGALLFCGAICSALCFWLQGYAQQYLSAFRASTINILEPVFASIFAYYFMGEALSSSFYLGASMILGAALLINWRLSSS